MTKHPLEHKCVDCKGTGIYQGLGALEDCQTCGGAGSLIGVEVNLLPKHTEQDDWDELAKVFERQAAGIRGGGVTNIKAAQKAGMSSPRRSAEIDLSKTTFIKGSGAPDIQLGETVYVFDAGWYETTVVRIYSSSGCVPMVGVSYSSGTMQIPTRDICWNITEDRLEYIRCGTPVW